MDPIVALLPLLRYLANKVRLPAGCILGREDLVQEAYLALVHRLPSCRATGGEARQAFIVARALGAMRDAVRNAEHSRSLRQHLDMPLDERAAPADDLDLRMSVQDAMVGLHPREAAVVSHWIAGRTERELAAELRMPVLSVHWWVSRARRALQHRLRSVVA